MNKLEKVDISLESRIVASIVSDTELLDKCASIIDPTLFESPVTQIVVEWSLDYYRHTNEAPGANLKDIFAEKSKDLNEADAQLVYAYMKRGDWSPTGNLEFAKHQLEDYIRERSMRRLVDKLKSKLESGNVKDCERAIADWQKPEVNKLKVFDLFQDHKMAAETLNREEEQELFRFDGDLGDTVGSFLATDYALWLAPPKRGKTWWLMYSALQAALQGNKVLYISLEMDEYETEERLLQMITGRSLHGEDVPGSAFRLCAENKWEVLDSVRPTKEINRSPKSLKRELLKVQHVSQGGEFKYIVAPTDSFSVKDLEDALKELEVFYHFVPTVVVLDYVDIMKFEFSKEKRIGLDKLNLQLRGLQQARKYCFISASQTGRETVTGENDAKEDNIAEATSKLNHSTKIILINQNKDEKKAGIYRINVNMSRHGGVNYETCVCVNNLSIGRPVIACHKLSDIYNPKEEVDGGKELEYAGFKRGKKKGRYEE